MTHLQLPIQEQLQRNVLATKVLKVNLQWVVLKVKQHADSYKWES